MIIMRIFYVRELSIFGYRNIWSKLNNEPTFKIDIPGYQPPLFIFTEAAKGGTVLYKANNINFKPRKDLEIYDSKNFESTFIEIMNSNESNVIIGVIYRHPNMDCSQFTNDKLNVLLKKLSLQRNKKVYIDGDFNYFGLLKADSHPETSEFYENLPLTYLPHLLQSIPK